MADGSASFKDATGATVNHDVRTNSGSEVRPVVVTGNDGDYVASVTPDSFAKVSLPPSGLFYDGFEGTVFDTADRWNVTGTAPTQTVGALTFPAAVSQNTQTQTKGSFSVQSSAYLNPAFAVKFEGATPGTGAGRFWGLGTAPTTPSATSLCQEGVGFEIDSATGALEAVTYTGGVSTIIATLTRPTDGLYHRYSMVYRNTRCYWFVDGTEVHVATATFLNVGIQNLPLLFSRFSGAALTGSPSFVVTAVGVGDLSRNSGAISDGTFMWRKAKVTTSGELLITDTLRNKQAVALANSGRFTVTVGADAALGGRLWLVNPIGSAVLLELRRVEFTSLPIATTAFLTSPRITVERFSFTGAPTGAQVAVVQRDTTDAALVATLRTAATGMSVTNNNAIAYAFSVAPTLTGVGNVQPNLLEWEPAENGRMVLRAGQGVVFRQADAGTASDTRQFQINLAWAEFTVPA